MTRAVALALLLLVAACGGDAADQSVPTNAVAVVDGEAVPKSDFDAIVAQARATYEKQDAKRHSQDTGSKANGGKLTVSRGQTVAAFEKKAFALKKNEAMTKWSDELKDEYEDKVSYAVGFHPPDPVTTGATTTDAEER